MGKEPIRSALHRHAEAARADEVMSVPCCARPGELLSLVTAGTRNGTKVQELARLLDGLAYLAPLPLDISLEHQNDGDEVGETIEAIAAAKAAAWSRRLQALGSDPLVVATDGGVLLPAMGKGWDPTRTRRFAGEHADARARADALIALANQLDRDQRRIGWREAVAIARRGEVIALFAAESDPGVLAGDYDSALVDAGEFWVSALWICPEFGGRRLAELTVRERASRDDHWSRLRPQLQRAFAGDPRLSCDGNGTGSQDGESGGEFAVITADPCTRSTVE